LHAQRRLRNTGNFTLNRLKTWEGLKILLAVTGNELALMEPQVSNDQTLNLPEDLPAQTVGALTTMDRSA
jgi:hypothetical protein